MNGDAVLSGNDDPKVNDHIELNNGLVSMAFNSKSISLPTNLISEDVDFALDIGGSLAKVSHICAYKESKDKRSCLLKLVTFEGDNVDDWINYIKAKVLYKSQGRNYSKYTAVATGTGSLKYFDRICHSFPGLKLYTDVNEFKITLYGIDTLWRHLSQEELLYKGGSSKDELKFATSLTSSGALPCLVACMGSALTIVLVNVTGQVVGIVGGSSQGGMSFLGLGSLITGATSFQELIDMASQGNRQTVDLTVKDTAGSDYNMAISDTLVSSFGKIAKLRRKYPDIQFQKEDLAASLLFLVTEEMTKTIYLSAKAQNVNTVLCCGSFFHNNPTAIQHVCEKIEICSTYLHHELRVHFLKNEGYLGAIGLLKKGHLRQCYNCVS